MKMDKKSTNLHSNDEDAKVIRPSGAGAEHCSPADVDFPLRILLSHTGSLTGTQGVPRQGFYTLKITEGPLFLVFAYVIWGVLPIYWASVFELYDHARDLHGWVMVVSIRPIYTPCFPKSVITFRISMAGPSARWWHKHLSVAPVQPQR
jgi:hypothetical protein